MTNRSPAETKQERHIGEHDMPVPYWPADMAYPDDEPIPYRLTGSGPHYQDFDMRAREAGL